MITAVVAGLIVDAVLRPWVGATRSARGAVAVGVTLVAPIQGMATLFGWWAVARFRSARHRNRHRSGHDAGLLEAAELVGLGLAGGLSLGAALAVARRHGRGGVSEGLDRLILDAGRRGIVVALTADRGPTAPLSSVLVAAATTGAPLGPAVAAFVTEQAHRRHSAAVAEARRLPVKLLIPLTLLVLPGFVLIAIGPTVIDSLARLTP